MLGLSQLAAPINLPIGMTIKEGNTNDMKHFEETYNQIMMTLTSAHRQLHNRMHNNGIYHDHTVIDEHHNEQRNWLTHIMI